MLSQLFLGISMIGANWVLYLLLLLSVISVAIMIERARYYQHATKGLEEFRSRVRSAVAQGQWEDARKAAEERLRGQRSQMDLESGLAAALLARNQGSSTPEVLGEVAQDSMIRGKLEWERNLMFLATVGNNAPFIGLFGTVMGVIRAFHDLSQTTAGVNTVSAGISEALVATAMGILVAIPAVAAYNLFQRRVKAALGEAEALKSFLIGRLAS